MSKVIEILFELLNQRQYTNINYNNDNIITATKPDGYNIIVFISTYIKFNVKCLSEYISLTNEMGIKHLLIVYKNGITSTTKKTIDTIKEDIYIELFEEDSLQFNITKHRLQPIFEILDKQEALEFKKRFGLKFPIMRKEDPIALFYDYKKGDIIRVIKKTGIIDYRIVK